MSITIRFSVTHPQLANLTIKCSNVNPPESILTLSQLPATICSLLISFFLSAHFLEQALKWLPWRASVYYSVNIIHINSIFSLTVFNAPQIRQVFYHHSPSWNQELFNSKFQSGSNLSFDFSFHMCSFCKLWSSLGGSAVNDFKKRYRCLKHTRKHE